MKTKIKIDRFSDDGTLLKIHRQFSKDESIVYLFDVINAKETQIGVLKSELDELKFNQDKIVKEYERKIKEIKATAVGEQKSKHEWKRKHDALLTTNH